VADFWFDVIRKYVVKTGEVVTIAGNKRLDHDGYKDGDGKTEALFSGPVGLVIDRDGGILVSEFKNKTIRKILKNGTVTTIIGRGSVGHLRGLTIDSEGTIYAVDSDSSHIKKFKKDSNSNYTITNLTKEPLSSPFGLIIEYRL